MRAATRVLTAAAQLVHRFIGPGDYGIAYGSHASGRASSRSDLDLVLVTVHPIEHVEREVLVSAVVTLHHELDLSLDTEVDHARKVHAAETDVDGATALRGFPDLMATGKGASTVIVEPWFLNSDTFRLRLLLNALSSPHVFLGGDVHRFESHRSAAERAVALLALASTEGAEPSTSELVQALCVHRDGAAGEDFLGYMPGPELYSVLRRGLSRLRAEGVTSSGDGDRYHRDWARLRTAIALSGNRTQGRTPRLR